MNIVDFNAPAARNISKIIKEKGLKQKYVAEQAGYSGQEFSDMLNGRKLIKVCEVPKIARVLGVTPDDIYAE